MKLAIVYPGMGKRPGERYLRSWQMEPLPSAALAGLTPPDVHVTFHDDRMGPIPFDAPTDLAAISVETYTARRAYQIASEYRARGVPVVMGGFHATLCPDEVARYAEAVVEGEAEASWPQLIDDFRHGRLRARYAAPDRPDLAGVRYDRSIFAGHRYLPIGLVETGRGCRFRCEFCAVQEFFGATHRARPVDAVVAELRTRRDHVRLFFFIDDNFAADLGAAKELLRALVPLRIRWVTQMSINAAHDEEFLQLLRASGCQGVLIGFESLEPRNLQQMNKQFNTTRGGYEVAIANLRRHGIRLYATFVFGYDEDTPESVRAAVQFAVEQRFFIAAFNHLTPFPGTALYERLLREGRFTHPQWWLDETYRYNLVPFRPRGMSAAEVREACLAARRDFYRTGSILRRGFDAVNGASPFMFTNFFLINLMHRREIGARDRHPLGDPSWQRPLLQVQ